MFLRADPCFVYSRVSAQGHKGTSRSKEATQYTFVPITRQEMQQWASKRQVNVNVNNAGLKNSAMQMFSEEGNTFKMLIRSLGYTQCVLVSNTKCKPKMCLFTRKRCRAPLSFPLSPYPKRMDHRFLGVSWLWNATKCGQNVGSQYFL